MAVLRRSDQINSPIPKKQKIQICGDSICDIARHVQEPTDIVWSKTIDINDLRPHAIAFAALLRCPTSADIAPGVIPSIRAA
jgi:hypothetical protein